MPLASDIEGVIEAENEGLTCCDVLREEVQELKWAVLAVACCLTFGGYYIYDFPGTLGTGLTDTIEQRFRESDKLYTQGMNQALYSVYSWPNLILSVVGGLLIDRYLGLRRAMLLFTGIILLGSILFYWGVRFVCFPLMLAGRVIFGFGGESLAVAQSAYVARWFRNGRGMALAFGITISCSRVGSSFNFIFAPLIAHHWGVCAAALSGVMACVLSLLACIVLVCADVHAVRIGYIRPEVRDADDDTQTKAPVMRLSDAARLPLVFWLMCIICMCSYTAIFPFIGIGKNFLEVKYGYPGYTAAKYMSSYQLSSAISSPLIGLIVDTMGRNTLWLILASFLFVMVHVLFMVTSIPGLVLLLAMGCFYSFLVSGLWPSIPLAVEENIVGFSYGLMTAIQNIGLATMPFVVGKILDGYVEKPSHPDVSGSSGLLSSSSSNSDTSGGKTGLPSLEGFMLTEVVFAATAAVSLFASVLLLVVDFRSKGILSASSSDRKAFLMLVSDRTPLLGVATEEASDENACIPPTETNVPTVHTEVNAHVQGEEDSKVVPSPSVRPGQPPSIASNNLPSGITEPHNVLKRPSPPKYIDSPNVSVESRRKQFEEKSREHPYRPPISLQRPSAGGGFHTNGSIGAKSPFAKSLEGKEDEMPGSGDRKKSFLRPEDSEKQGKLSSFIALYGNAPLYQLYDEHFKRKESRRLRHRLRESIRSLRQKRHGQRPLKQPRAIVAPPKFGPDDQSSSSSSSSSASLSTDDENEQKMPNLGKTSSFTVIKRDLSHKRSVVERTAKMGEMNNVAMEFSGTGPSRVRWTDMPEVIRRNLAAGLTKEQRSLQEARFEIITSEASYYKSLTVLIDLFYKAPVFTPTAPNAVITEFDKHQLFSNILNIHTTSENLLHSLEMSFRNDPMLENICDILYDHAETKLSYYVTYVKNQIYQTRTLSKLLNRPAFKEAVQNIQSMPQCSALDLNSFLVLPMQRVMRLRLLVTAVIHYTPRSSSAYTSGLVALASLEKLISECNAQKGQMEQKERLVTLSSQLEFKSNLRAIGTGNRELIKEGNLRLMETSNHPNAAFRRKFSEAIKNKPTQITLFLFSDVLLVARRRGEKYLVEDISPVHDLRVTIETLGEEDMIKRTGLKMKANPDDPFYIVPNLRHESSVSVRRPQEHQTMRQSNRFRERSRSRGGSARHFAGTGSGTAGASTLSGASGTAEGGVNLIGYPFILTFQSTDLTIVGYHFLCDTLSQRERWVDALQSNYYSVPPEISYDTWDCPQVIAVVSYGATERDELDVKEGDLMNVIVELSDGWLKGVLPDGRQGWVPKSVCQHVEDPQARRQNMKNFLLSEEAQRAYQDRKQQRPAEMFVRVHDLRDTRI